MNENARPPELQLRRGHLVFATIRRFMLQLMMVVLLSCVYGDSHDEERTSRKRFVRVFICRLMRKFILLYYFIKACFVEFLTQYTLMPKLQYAMF